MRSLLISMAVAWLSTAAIAADWEPVTTELLQKEKPGYGGLSGVAVDRSTGDVFIDVSDRGVFRTHDHGKTWNRLGKDVIKGRTESPGCLQLDPSGKTNRLVMATVYGGPIAIGSSEKGDWRFLDKASVHVDWCAVDWSDADLNFILALKHESGGLLLRSLDGGQTFTESGKGYGPAWIFDAKTAVVSVPKSQTRKKGELVRTTDGGQTFKTCAEYGPVSLPRWHEGSLYWLADAQLIKTTNQGERWEKVCDVKDGRFGPVFGKTASDMFVLTTAGVIESRDGGTTWAKPIPIPKAMKDINQLTWLAYDPKEDILYLMKMGSELYRLTQR